MRTKVCPCGATFTPNSGSQKKCDRCRGFKLKPRCEAGPMTVRCALCQWTAEGHRPPSHGCPACPRREGARDLRRAPPGTESDPLGRSGVANTSRAGGRSTAQPSCSVMADNRPRAVFVAAADGGEKGCARGRRIKSSCGLAVYRRSLWPHSSWPWFWPWPAHSSWDMTTTAYFGQPGHFTRSVEHQIYPHRAEALWLTAVVFAALGVCVVLPRPLAALIYRRATAR